MVLFANVWYRNFVSHKNHEWLQKLSNTPRHQTVLVTITQGFEQEEDDD